jgi:hypothetical protein
VASEDKHPSTTHHRPQVDAQRRRFAKGGLAAPVVVGTLLSRPVLGATGHNCSISGQLSGNVSTHQQVTCSSLGQSPETWLPAWPWGQSADFYNASRNTLAGARNFSATPNSLSVRFADAYRAADIDGTTPNLTRAATVLEVFLGYVPVYDTTFGYQPSADPKFQLRVRVGAGYSDPGFELGKEAIATYRNATTAIDFPLTGPEVVTMFNAVIVAGGTYAVSSTVNWNASQVLAYFQSLHP